MSGEFLREIQKWVAQSVTHEYDNWTPYQGGSRLLLGTLAYGRYADRFMRYCVPSLCSKGNLASLPSRPTLVVHTDQDSLHLLKPGLEDLQEIVDVELYPISDSLATLVEQNFDSRYVLLGASELVHMKRAFFRGMHYHCLFPDCVYASGYFENLSRLTQRGHKAILSHAISGSLEGCGKQIETDIAPVRLATLALSSLHDKQKYFIMNGRTGDNLPIVAHFIYVGQDRVCITGMHATIVFLHNSLLSFAPLRLNTTLDAQVPFYVPESVPLYMPQRDDNMVLVELSDKDWINFYRRPGCSLKELALRFWVIAEGDRGFERILALTTEFPIAGYTGSIAPLAEDQIRSSAKEIRDYIGGIYSEVDRAFDMGGVLEENGLNGPLSLPQDRLQEKIRQATGGAHARHG